MGAIEPECSDFPVSSMDRQIVAIGAASASNYLLIIPDQLVSQDAVESFVGPVPADTRVGVLCGARPQPNGLRQFVADLAGDIARSEFKRATVVGIGAGAAAAQLLAIFHPKSVRRLVLVNAITRTPITFRERVLQRIGRLLPAGLPLRLQPDTFDTRSAVHRITCPTLVVSTAEATPFVRAQSRFIAQRIPNSWLREHGLTTNPSTVPTGSSEQVRSLLPVVNSFSHVNVKRPQKNLHRETQSSKSSDSGEGSQKSAV